MTDFVVRYIKHIWFFCHRVAIYVVPWAWIFLDGFWGIDIGSIYFIIVMSWLLNNNRCLITQLEYYLFGETFMGRGEIFNVPFLHRAILYGNSALLILFRLLTIEI